MKIKTRIIIMLVASGGCAMGFLHDFSRGHIGMGIFGACMTVYGLWVGSIAIDALVEDVKKK